MRTRDFDFIETRLLAPMTGAGEAYDRLRQVSVDEGNPDAGRLADELMAAMRDFNDVCRRLRSQLGQRQAVR